MRWKFTLNPDTDNLLISEPIGWADIEFTLLRDKEWHGVFFEYSIPVKFYNDPNDSAKNAYTYLRNLYELNGIASSVILKVEMACSDTDIFTEAAQWRLDFSTYKEERGVDCVAVMQVEPDNMLMTFRNRYDQKVDLSSLTSFDGTELDAYSKLGFTLTLKAKAVPVSSDVKWSGTAEDINFTELDTIVAGAGTAVHNVIAYIQLGYNIIVLDEINYRAEIESAAYGAVSGIQPTWTIHTPGDYTLTFPDFTFTVNAQADTDAINTSCSLADKYNDLSVEVWVDVDGVATLLDSAALVPGCYDSGDTITITIDPFLTHTFTTTAADVQVKLYVRVEASGVWNKQLLSANDISWSINYNQTGRNVLLTGNEYYQDTTTKAFMINETGSRILESITNDNYRFLSNYFGRTDSEPYPAPLGIDGCGALRVLTLGLLIRNFGSERFSLSFKQFFEGLNPIDNIGIGIEDDGERSGYKVVRSEPMEFYYDGTVILQLDKIPFVEIFSLPDRHFSNVEIGFNKWEAEEYTGLDEFATKRTYRTTLTSTSQPFQKLSDFIASGYALELTRRKQYLITSKEDWRFDDDTFIICIKRGGSGTLVVEQGNITGEANLIDATTVYNFRISPARNAIRWLKTILNSYRNPLAADSKIIFTDGDGNFLAAGLVTGGCLVESAVLEENGELSFESSSDPYAAMPLFLPEEWVFPFPLSLTDYTTLKNAPTKTIQGRFGQDDDFRDFYISEIRYKPNEGIANFKLLPRRAYPIDPCSTYVVQARGTGLNTVGSALLVGAEIANLFLIVNGEFMKYNDANPANNEITSFNTLTGYFTLNFSVPAGQQVSIIHIPPTDRGCSNCIHRYEGRGSGLTTKTITGFGVATLANMFVIYNGQLMKYNDVVAANNELISYVSGTEVLTFRGATSVNRELRVFGFANCECIRTYSNRGDGTNNPNVSVGDGTLANVFVFYNGNLLKYNDSNVANNEITGYDSAVPEVTLNFTTNANREVRAFKLENC